MDEKTAKRLVSKYSMFKFKANSQRSLTLYSYHFANPEVYAQEPGATELRGIVFDKDGELVARPFPKFFNFGEPCCRVTLGDRATTTMKYDGSMVTAFLHDGGIRLASKGSLDSWVTRRASGLLTGAHEELVRSVPGRTAIFELVDPQNPVVLQYDEPALVLVGLRRNKDGLLSPPEELVEAGECFGVPATEILHRQVRVEEILEDVRDRPEMEGIVGYTGRQGHQLFKVKTHWYFKYHKACTQMTDKLIRQLFVNGDLDDILPMLPPERRREVEEKAARLSARIDRRVREVERFFAEHQFTSRKELALKLHELYGKPPKLYFDIYEGIPVREAVFNYFKVRGG